ncbi:MAG: NifU family protein [Cytophagaceae bacterium]|nr:NifU family protein [Cytophagaceae bacterium]MDW8456855.1 NifU family protein [Cytophagaceae bacterium]
METPHKLINIYTESNPNPNSMKFCVDFMLSPDSVDYPTAASASNCPLALDLFRFSFVKRVFISSNFITITKAEDIEWEEIIPMLKALIKGYLEEGRPLFTEPHKNESLQIHADDPEVVQKIKLMLEEYIRPAVEQDGGAITYKSFSDGIVTVQLQGSCSGCPSSTLTLKAGIENLLKKMVPEVKEVVAESV